MYPPKEDSIFFAEFLKKYLSKLKNKNISFLDMGTGSGILAETALSSGIPLENILGADIDKESVDYVKKKKIKAAKSNLFSKLKNQKFDIIVFNAPYLPEDEYDKKQDTTGGKHGDEIPLEFIKQAKKHLNKNGKIFLLISSHTPQNKIKKFKPKIITTKKIFFEELLILQVK